MERVCLSVREPYDKALYCISSEIIQNVVASSRLNKHIMRGLFFITIILFFSNISLAQSTGRINGTVTDATTQQAIGYATITLSDTNNHVINGAMSDSMGQFSISHIPNGNYFITVDFIAYRQHKTGILTISDNHPTISVGNIALKPAYNNLHDVTITGKALVLVNSIDKITYNPANDISSQGGAAIDVLKKVPMVSVDIDGTVSLQGNSNIRFLINGKPSSIFGNSLSDALASIPASQIQSIEVITSPGAKYDAQGTGGIINIILKNNKAKGINSSINLSTGTRLENASLNVNYRHNNFGLNAFFSGNKQLVSRTPLSQDVHSYDSIINTSTHLMQDGYSDFQRNSYQSGLGFDWDLSKRANITGGISYFYFTNSDSGPTNQEQQTFDAANNVLSDISTIRQSESNAHLHSFDWNLAYHKSFAKKGRTLDLLYNASYGTPYNTYAQTQYYIGQPTPYKGATGNNPGTDKETDIAVDYGDSIGHTVAIATGVKATLRNINSTNDVYAYNTTTQEYIPDASQTYNFNYRQDVYAAYCSLAFRLFHFIDTRVGGRVEHTVTAIDYPNTAIPDNDIYSPSVLLSHKLPHHQMIKFAYSYRIERPEYREVNPFVNTSDPNNLTTGNPLLLPELEHHFELGYNRSFTNGSYIYVAITEKYNTQDHKPVTTFYPTYKVGDSVYTNVSVTRRENAGQEYNPGIYISASVALTDKLNLRTNVAFTQRRIISEIGTGNVVSGIRVRGNINATYQLSYNITFEGFCNYNSAVQSLQGQAPQSLIYTLAFRKEFHHRQGSLGITTTNLFTKYVNQVYTIESTDYQSYNTKRVPYRSVGISFSWKLGKLEFKKSKTEGRDYIKDLPPNAGAS